MTRRLARRAAVGAISGRDGSDYRAARSGRWRAICLSNTRRNRFVRQRGGLLALGRIVLDSRLAFPAARQ